MKITKILIALTLGLGIVWLPKIVNSRPNNLRLKQSIDLNKQKKKLGEKENQNYPSNISSNSSQPKIQIAILLDSSNSMDGLIDQTRTQVWKIVNALTDVTKNGQVPALEVALYHYGNDTLPSEEGFLQLLTGLTPELDLVSEKLFKIKTNGGQEYAGWVINSAMKELSWSNSPEDFRAIFIAGNEAFDQGPIEFSQSIKLAINQDTLVNTIYCGNSENSERNLWSEGANLANGSHVNIDQNQKTVVIESPYDQQIAEWNAKLNETYIPYGRYGTEGQQRQVTEDANASRNFTTRGYSKTSGYYRNASWDLVDALDEDLVQLEDLNNEVLPEEMHNMTIQEKYDYVEEIATERERIQAKIRELYQLRTEYVKQKTAELSSEQTNTLDYVMIQTLREQLAAKGFEL